MEENIDFWQKYRAEVAKVMLPVIYAKVTKESNQGMFQSQSTRAVEDTVDIAVAMAKRLSNQLKEK